MNDVRSRNRIRMISLFLISVFVFDQVVLTVADKHIKVYYALSVIAFLAMARFWNRLFTVRETRFLLLSAVLGQVLNLLADSLIGASVAYIALLFQLIITLTVFLALDRDMLELKDLEKLVFEIILICMVFAIIQYGVYLVTGYPIGFTEKKVLISQLSIGQIPSFRYESNAYGKLLCWGILFFIPGVTRGNRKQILFLIISIGILFLSMTRTAFYSMIVACMVWLIVENKNGTIRRLLGIMVIGLITLLAGLLVIVSGIVQVGEYTLYKLMNIFNSLLSVSNDGSGNYRVESMKLAIKIWGAKWKSIILGMGYGQCIGDMSFVGGPSNGTVGMSDVISIMTSFGVIALVVFILFYICLCVKLYSRLKRPDLSGECRVWTERCLYWIVYFTVLQMLSGCFLYPEYWLTIGITIYILNCDPREKIP